MKITVRVPATTANLGPGFDSFGCALGIYNEYEFSESDIGWNISGCPERYRTPDNLTARAYTAVANRAGISTDGETLRISANIPLSRGLGSSAAMIAGGALAANERFGRPFGLDKILEICTEIEGHPDNLAPALYGGLTVSTCDGGIPEVFSCPIASSLHFVACIPDFELSTARARRVLPSAVPYADAVYNLSHAAALIKALECGDPTRISRAMNDRLHHPYRIPLIPDFDAVRAAAIECGACGFCISGAGPTLLALTAEERFADRLRAVLPERTVRKWKILDLPVDRDGATVSLKE